MTKLTNPIGVVNHCYEHIASKAKEMGGINMSTTKEKLSHDGRANMWTTIVMGAITLIALGTISYIQPSLSTASNRADSNTVSVIKNEAILSEFKTNQEKHNDSIDKKIDVLTNNVIVMDTKINALTTQINNIDKKMEGLATKDDIARIEKFLGEINNKK